MTTDGPITPHDLRDHKSSIIRKFGVLTYLHCWFDIMIRHRRTQFLVCVFACLTAAA